MIRPAAARDLPGILDIYNEAIATSTAVYSYAPMTMADIHGWYDDKLGGGYPVLVYERDSTVAGFASYGPFRTRPAYKYTVEHSVYVAPAYRGNGLGGDLLRAIVDLAAANGFAIMVGGLDSANASSIRLHERHGFIHAGTIRKAGYKFGRWLDLAFYQLELPGPALPEES